MESITTSKGQVTIPSTICRALGIKRGTYIRIDLDESNRKIILTPITREFIHHLRGKYKGKGLMKALKAEKKRANLPPNSSLQEKFESQRKHHDKKEKTS